MFKINATGTALDATYEQAHRTVFRIHRAATEYYSQVTTGDVEANEIVSMFNSLITFKAALNAIKATPGIGDYAKTMVDDPTYDIGAEFTSVITAITNTVSWMHDNFPKSTSDYWEVYKTNVSGDYTYRVFNTTQLTGLAGQLNNLLNTIEVV